MQSSSKVGPSFELCAIVGMERQRELCLANMSRYDLDISEIADCCRDLST
jgi:hypothetical protein